MQELPLVEKYVFVVILLTYFVSSVMGVRQLSSDSGKSRRMLLSLVSLGVSLESVMLVFRAVSIKAVPLTGLFESMIVLTLVFGLTFLFLSTVIRQVWFSSVMVWMIFAIALLSAVVATPATQPQAIAKTPWVIVHGIVMMLSVVSIAFAAGSATLFLVCRRNLKQKQIVKVIGKMPNIQKLERMNLLSLKSCFVFMTFGLVSGVGLAMVTFAGLGINIGDWLVDSKIILMAVSWVLVAIILGLRHIIVLKSRTIAQLTLLTFFLILFAVVGSAIFCGTSHDFSGNDIKTVEQ